MRSALELLRFCQAEIPSTRAHQRHSIAYEDEQGGTLVLTLLLGDTWQRINLREEDLDRAPSELVEEIKRLLGSAPRVA